MDKSAPSEQTAKKVVSPESTVKFMSGGFEAGDRFDRETYLWNPPDQSADDDTIPDKFKVDARARDMLRNDAFAMSAIRMHRDSIVGSRFRLNAKPRFEVLGQSEEWAREFQDEVETKFTLWAESMNCWPDAARRLTFTELVRQAIGVFVYSGEYLATVEWRSVESDRPMSTAIQAIEPNRLSDPLNYTGPHPWTRGNMKRNVRAGVRMSRMGRPLGYYIQNSRYQGTNTYDYYDQFRWTYVRAHSSRFGPLAMRPQVIHLVDQDRPTQTRGISQLVSALKEMRITKRYRDVVLQNAAVNAMYAATIESELPDKTVYEQLGAGDIGDAAVDYATRMLAGIAEFSESARSMHLDGVKIPHLFPGTKLNLQPAGQPGGIGTEFEQSLLRYLAACFGVSYEELSKDYQQSSYSSSRSALNATAKSMSSRKYFVANRLASLIYRLWFEEAIGSGMIETMMDMSLPNFYEPFMMEAYCNAQWIGAGAGQIDEMKETEAAALRIKMGFSTHEKECSRFGEDYREVFDQIARERERMKELDILPMDLQNMPEPGAAPGEGSDNEGSDGPPSGPA